MTLWTTYHYPYAARFANFFIVCNVTGEVEEVGKKQMYPATLMGQASGGLPRVQYSHSHYFCMCFRKACLIAEPKFCFIFSHKNLQASVVHLLSNIYIIEGKVQVLCMWELRLASFVPVVFWLLCCIIWRTNTLTKILS